MAATFRQIVNNVLANIGATQIPASQTTVTDTYQLQVCNFVNHIKEEVEAAAQWSALWKTFNMAVPASVITAQVTDSTGQTANSRSRMVRMYNHRFGREVSLCFNTTTFGIPFLVGEMPLADLIYYNTVLNQTPVAYSTNFTLQDVGNDNMQMLFYPATNGSYNIQATLVVPQPRIDATVAGSAAYPWTDPSGFNLWTGSTVGLDSPILVPNYPIELGSSWYALQERGEELGAGSMFTEERYRDALDDQVSRDPGTAYLEMIVA
jgi:hypothetical protein